VGQPTGATGPVGELRADLIVTNDKAPAQVKKDLEEIGKTTDVEMEKIGKEAGESFDEGVKKSTKNTGRDVARSLSDGIAREGLDVTRIVQRFDREGNLIQTWLTSEVRKGEKAVADLAASGEFKKIGNAFRDAVGAGFNVSGKSPLIALLVPLLGFIAELVAGAIQIVNGLVAVLAVIPNAIGAVILQVGVLFLAFKGLGTAIQGAFAAKNAEELQKALEGLTPSAQEFVRTLLPLRDVFNQLADIAQENFFDRMAASLQRVVDALGPILAGGIGEIAGALGDVARGILNVLANPVFTRFLSELIPATVDWLHSFNSAFQDFLIGLADFGAAVQPFFSWLGESLNQALAEFGVWLGNLSVDPEFIQWLEDMKTNLADGAEALGAILKFLKEFVDALDDAGGNEALKDITAQFNELAKFLATDEGTKAMEGLLHVIQILAYTFVFLVNDIILFLFLFEVTAEFLKVLFTQWIPSWLEWLGHAFVDWALFVYHLFGDFFTNKIPEFFVWLGGYISGFVNDYLIAPFGAAFTWLVTALGTLIGNIITGLLEGAASVAIWIKDRVEDVVNFFKSIPQRIADAVGSLEDTLFGQGQNLIKGLINGIISMSGPLGAVVAKLLQERVKNQVPSSPAKTGPLSGKGDTLYGGQEIAKRLAEGIEMEGPTVGAATSNAISNVNAAVTMNFYGPTPTPQQAGAIGTSAGNSLASTLAQRNVQLAVRGMGLTA
jgi:hypothetical protein